MFSVQVVTTQADTMAGKVLLFVVSMIFVCSIFLVSAAVSAATQICLSAPNKIRYLIARWQNTFFFLFALACLNHFLSSVVFLFEYWQCVYVCVCVQAAPTESKKMCSVLLTLKCVLLVKVFAAQQTQLYTTVNCCCCGCCCWVSGDQSMVTANVSKKQQQQQQTSLKDAEVAAVQNVLNMATAR